MTYKGGKTPLPWGERPDEPKAQPGAGGVVLQMFRLHPPGVRAFGSPIAAPDVCPPRRSLPSISSGPKACLQGGGTRLVGDPRTLVPAAKRFLYFSLIVIFRNRLPGMGLARVFSATEPSAGAVEPLPGLIGSSRKMQEVYRLTRQVAGSNASVLLLGETGTGKELVARAIHRLSPRAGGPFIRVNCGALAETLLESELFGHVRGAFTGAMENRTGRFEAAHTGTIFLDEINSTSLHLQVKLLRVLQEQEFERVGDTHTIRVDVRVIAASNRDLLEEVHSGRFREDLYYRLNVITITLPPLRERREDIPELVSHFLRVYAERNGRRIRHVEPAAMEALQDYDWPGNVRELQNYIERAVLLAPGDVLTVDLLADPVLGRGPQRRRPTDQMDLESLLEEFIRRLLAEAQRSFSSEPLYEQVLHRVERELIRQVLADCGGIQVKAAGRLGLNRNTLYKKIKQYGLESSSEEPPTRS
jgi:DNA-binding NtrC family response regulator